MIFGYLNPSILYFMDTINYALNYISLIGFCIFMPLLLSLYIERVDVFFKCNTKIKINCLIEFVFVFMICFPFGIFCRTGLVFHDGLYVPFRGRAQESINSYLFDEFYWYTIIFGTVFSVVFLLYLKKCEDKKTFIYKAVFALALQDLIYRSTFFFYHPFGAKIFVDSSCEFLIVSMLIYLFFDRKSFGYFSGLVCAPIALLYTLLNRFSDVTYNFFYYFTINSICFHIMMVPIGFSVFFLGLKNSFKDILRSLYLPSCLILFYAIFINAVGIVEEYFCIDLNYEYLNGFMYFQCIIPFLSDVIFSWKLSYGRILIFPLNLLFNMLMYSFLEVLTYSFWFFVKHFKYISRKIQMVDN